MAKTERYNKGPKWLIRYFTPYGRREAREERDDADHDASN